MTHSSLAQCPTLPVLGRLCEMKDRQDGRNRRNGSEGDETLSELLSSYTPKQRETLLKGFRILARVAVRARMERQASGSNTAPDEGGQKEG